uniref:GAGE domain-containing protein n=1 Tax=Pongo abelii TaxID=9601 RepID=A0A8I5UEQ5_PONAB
MHLCIYIIDFLFAHNLNTLRSSSPLRKNVKKRNHQLKIRVLHLVGRSKMKGHLLFKVKEEWRIMLTGGEGPDMEAFQQELALLKIEDEPGDGPDVRKGTLPTFDATKVLEAGDVQP